MNLYVNSKALIKYKKEIEKLFMFDGGLSIFCELTGIFSLINVHKIVKRRFKVYPTYIASNSSLSRTLCKLYNSDKVNLELVINEKLSIHTKRLINKIVKTIKIVDSSQCKENYDFYKNSKNIIFNSSFGSNFNEAVSFDLAYFNSTNYVCNYSSCLGKTLYLDAKGDFYFCYYHKNKSYLKNIKNCSTVEAIFDAENFMNTLNIATEKRTKCKKNCDIFKKCHGDCPLNNDDCKSLIEAIRKSSDERSKMILNQINLNTLPLYKKDSLLKEISKFPR